MGEKYLGKTDTEKNTIVDETKQLLKGVDVAENAEDDIGAFFEKLDTYDEADKLQLLHDVLQEGTITIGNGDKSLKEVADDFTQHIMQDEDTWKVKEKADLPEEKTYLEQFLNQKNSSLAFLIQKTANFISLEAQRGYGANKNVIESIGEDKILGNQTRRALEGLKSWIENSNALTFDESKPYTAEDIKGMKFISKDFLVALKTKNKELFDTFWKEEDGTFSPLEGFKFAQEWSNNYAIIDQNNAPTNDENGTVQTETEEPPVESVVTVETGNTEPLSQAVYDTLMKEVKGMYSNDTIRTNSRDTKTQQTLKNPFITIIQTKPVEYTKTDNTKSTISNAFSYHFNIRNYLKEGILDTELLKQTLTDKMDALVKEKKQQLENKAQEQALNSIKLKNHQEILTLRNKKYTLSDLYGENSEKLKQIGYKTFIDRFIDHKIAFHETGYFSIKDNDIVFDFEQDGGDDDYAENISIPLSEFTGENDKLDEEKFKIALGKKIDEIVETNFKV